MATASAKITMTADGKPIAALQKLIAERIKFTNESAKESLAACAIQILISVRAATSVAKAGKIAVVEEGALYPSFKMEGKTKVPCLRYQGSGARYLPQKGTRVIYPAKGVKFSSCRVYSFLDMRGEKKTEYLIVATSADAAKKTAERIVQRRIEKHKGLAKLALGKLMNKAAKTSKPTNGGNDDTRRIADEVSRAFATGVGTGEKGRYTLTCEDNLDYALDALKGGQAAFDMACAKAANKIAAVLKKKVADKILAPQIDVPFPEIRSRK